MGMPQPGQHFYGTVIGGEEGMLVSAVMGDQVAQCDVDDSLHYGYNPPFIVESGRGSRIHGKTGEKVVFYVNEKEVIEADFEVWGMTKLDLPYFVPEPPPPPPPPPPEPEYADVTIHLLEDDVSVLVDFVEANGWEIL